MSNEPLASESTPKMSTLEEEKSKDEVRRCAVERGRDRQSSYGVPSR